MPWLLPTQPPPAAPWSVSQRGQGMRGDATRRSSWDASEEEEEEEGALRGGGVAAAGRTRAYLCGQIGVFLGQGGAVGFVWAKQAPDSRRDNHQRRHGAGGARRSPPLFDHKDSQRGVWPPACQPRTLAPRGPGSQQGFRPRVSFRQQGTEDERGGGLRAPRGAGWSCWACVVGGVMCMHSSTPGRGQKHNNRFGCRRPFDHITPGTTACQWGPSMSPS